MNKTEEAIPNSQNHCRIKENNVYKVFNRVSGTSLIPQLVNNPPAMQQTLVRFLGQEDPLEKA